MATLDVAQFGAATRGGSENTQGLLLLDSSGALVVIDLFAKLIQDGLGYQVRAGTVTTPLVGDVVITDTAADYAVTAASGKVVVPVYQCISINLGGGNNPISLNEVLGFIEQALGKKAVYNRKPFHVADIDSTWADITKAKNLLGWEPRVTPMDGFQRCVDWYRANKAWLKDVQL